MLSKSHLIVYILQGRHSRKWRVGFALESYRAELPLFQWDLCPWVTPVFFENPLLRDFCRQIRKLHEEMGLSFPSSARSHSEPYPLYIIMYKSCPCSVSHSLCEGHQKPVLQNIRKRISQATKLSQVFRLSRGLHQDSHAKAVPCV